YESGVVHTLLCRAPLSYASHSGACRLDREGGAEAGQGAVAVAVGGPGFQAYRALITHIRQGSGDGRVVDLAGAGLAPAGHVGHLDLADQRPGPPDQL